MRKEKTLELEKYINELKWIKKEIVKTDKSFISIIPQEFELNNGIIIRREQILKNNNDGSAVIIIPVVNNEYLVTIEPRVFTKNKVSVGFPAGYVEENEETETSALRELREETGYVPKELIHLDSFYQDEGISGAYNHIYLALDCEKKYDQDLDSDEVVKYMTFTLEELEELERLGYICSSNAKLSLCRIKERKN